MKIADDYVEQVLAQLPQATPQREQIAMELRGHIAERMEDGRPAEDVIRQLGDPRMLAESYLNAVPLVSARFGQRVIAKLVDAAIVIGAAALPALIVSLLVRRDAIPFVVIGALGVASIGFVLYTIIAEARFGLTPGKSLAGVRVVRESGASISTGQAIVRQLPLLLSIFLIDALFALFTEKNQRAFELLSKTRVVMR